MLFKNRKLVYLTIIISVIIFYNVLIRLYYYAKNSIKKDLINTKEDFDKIRIRMYIFSLSISLVTIIVISIMINIRIRLKKEIQPTLYTTFMILLIITLGHLIQLLKFTETKIN